MGSNNQGARRSRSRRDDILSLPDPPVILKGPQNYLRWRRAMKLELERIGMLSILDETVRVPAVIGNRREDYNNEEYLKEINKLILSWISKSVSREIKDTMESFMAAGVVFKVWKELKQVYSPGDGFIIVDIKEEIHSLRGKTRNLSEYLDKFNALWKELETLLHGSDDGDNNKCGCGNCKKEKEQEKLAWLLKGLDQRFSKTKSEIMRKNPLPSFDEVVSRLLAQELQEA